MPAFLKSYYDTEGPFGLPMRDRQAQELERIVRFLPKQTHYQPQKRLVSATPVLHPDERCDISWISEESPDRQRDIVLAAGMDDSHFRLNPLVTMNHAYWLPPVGTSLWRQMVSEDHLTGIKAKTHYQPRPENWPGGQDWPPDIALTLVQAGLLRGKSVGFLPLQMRRPTSADIADNPAMANVRYIIEKWLLLEYACVYLPAQQNAVVEAVSKHWQLSPTLRQALGWANSTPQTPEQISFTPLAELEKAFERRVQAVNIPFLVESAWNQARGQV